jgi:hypothetical protein
MTQINELTTLLKPHFHWNKARLDCLVGMVLALFYKETINLTKLAQAFPNSAKAGSHYRRVQRFISDAHCVDYEGVARFIMTLFGFLATDYELTLDRTNWRWGKKNINRVVFTVNYYFSIAYVDNFWMCRRKT